MKQMIDDLLIFMRTRLGDALPVSFTPQDDGQICRGAVEGVWASYPDAQIKLHLAGELQARWDGSRLIELLLNQVTNAVRYGSSTVVVEADTQEGQMTLAVSNEVNPIPDRALPALSDPLSCVRSALARCGGRHGLGSVHLPLHCSRASGNNRRCLVGERHPPHRVPAALAGGPNRPKPIANRPVRRDSCWRNSTLRCPASPTGLYLIPWWRRQARLGRGQSFDDRPHPVRVARSHLTWVLQCRTVLAGRLQADDCH